VVVVDTDASPGDVTCRATIYKMAIDCGWNKYQVVWTYKQLRPQPPCRLLLHTAWQELRRIVMICYFSSLPDDHDVTCRAGYASNSIRFITGRPTHRTAYRCCRLLSGAKWVFQGRHTAPINVKITGGAKFHVHRGRNVGMQPLNGQNLEFCPQIFPS